MFEPDPSAGLHALVCDLLGEDPDAPEPARPAVREALAICGRGQVMAARRGARQVALVVLHDGRCYEVPDACPHTGAPLSAGFVDGSRLVCPHHGWEFDLEHGTCPGRPRVSLAVTRLPDQGPGPGPSRSMAHPAHQK